jgi:organic radical activating enzyme
MDSDRLEAARAADAAELIEVFSSIQGEGLRVGELHLFVRGGHCDIHCRYCDTPLSHAAQKQARLETAPGSREFETVPNPVPLEDVERRVERALRAARHAAVAFTGGEPLLQPWLLQRLAPVVRESGSRVLLETDGNLPETYRKVRDLVDVLSLDWKLPSATGEPPRYTEHQGFLELVGSGECWVKAVFTGETAVSEVLEAARRIAAVRPETTLILQPCSPFGRVTEAPPPELTTHLQLRAAEVLKDVRVIPQVHHLLRQP